jgi:hypothetical protein
LARALTDELLDAGLPVRILMAMPPRLPKVWTEAEVSLEAEKAYHDVLDKAFALDFWRDGKGEESPYMLNWDSEAKSLWVEHYNAWGIEQQNAEGVLAAALSKLEGYGARLAMLHHVISCLARGEDDRKAVKVESALAGIKLCRWFAAEARRIYKMVAEPDEQAATRRLIEFLQQRGGAITANELRASNVHKYLTNEAAEFSLEELAKAGLGIWRPRTQGVQGGRPTREFVLTLPETETSKNTENEGVSVSDKPNEAEPMDDHGDSWEGDS